MCAKRLTDDWQRRYAYKPVLLETFVEAHRFHGTCYKAANWIYVGQTKGLGKYAVGTKPTLPKKDVWLYPLIHSYRSILCDPT